MLGSWIGTCLVFSCFLGQCEQQLEQVRIFQEEFGNLLNTFTVSFDFSMAHTIPRILTLDMLPVIAPSHIELFIKSVDIVEVSWTTYLNPISTNLWLMLVCVAILIAIVLSGIEKLMPLSKLKYSHMITLKSFISHYWIALKSNFGGKPASVHKNNSYQIAVFVCLLAGSIVWIFYRAFLTSELSIIKLKQPFNDLESFLASDYK